MLLAVGYKDVQPVFWFAGMVKLDLIAIGCNRNDFGFDLGIWRLAFREIQFPGAGEVGMRGGLRERGATESSAERD